MRIVSKTAVAMAVSSFLIPAVCTKIYGNLMLWQTGVVWLTFVSLYVLALSLFVIVFDKDIRKRFRAIALILGLIVALFSATPFLLGPPYLDSERILAILCSVFFYTGLSAIFAIAFKIYSKREKPRRHISKGLIILLILLGLSILANVQLWSTVKEREAQIGEYETEIARHKIAKNAMQELLKLFKEDLEQKAQTSGWHTQASAGVTLSSDPSAKRISYNLRCKLEWEIVKSEERWKIIFTITVNNEGSEEIRIKDISIELPLVIFWDRTEDLGIGYRDSVDRAIPKGTVSTLGPYSIPYYTGFKDKPLKILYKVSFNFAVIIDGKEYFNERPIVIDNLWVYD